MTLPAAPEPPCFHFGGHRWPLHKDGKDWFGGTSKAWIKLDTDLNCAYLTLRGRTDEITFRAFGTGTLPLIALQVTLEAHGISTDDLV